MTMYFIWLQKIEITFFKVAQSFQAHLPLCPGWKNFMEILKWVFRALSSRDRSYILKLTVLFLFLECNSTFSLTRIFHRRGMLGRGKMNSLLFLLLFPWHNKVNRLDSSFCRLGTQDIGKVFRFLQYLALKLSYYHSKKVFVKS